MILVWVREPIQLFPKEILDSVLSSKPEDRRALIEEAAGVLKHKERKAKAERKLARMDINLTRVQDIVQEVERQV